jgi:hypothetical protein
VWPKIKCPKEDYGYFFVRPVMLRSCSVQPMSPNEEKDVELEQTEQSLAVCPSISLWSHFCGIVPLFFWDSTPTSFTTIYCLVTNTSPITSPSATDHKFQVGTDFIHHIISKF